MKHCVGAGLCHNVGLHDLYRVVYYKNFCLANLTVAYH